MQKREGAPCAALRAAGQQLSRPLEMADAASMAAAVKADINALHKNGILEKMRAGMDPKAEVSAKEEACNIYTALATTVGLPAEAYLVAQLPALLDLHSDKANTVRALAETAGRALSAILNPHALKKARAAGCWNMLRKPRMLQDASGLVVTRRVGGCTTPA